MTSLHLNFWLIFALAMGQSTQPAPAVEDPLETLQVEIDQLLLPTGRLPGHHRSEGLQLEELARRSGELARNANRGQRILAAHLIEMRAYNALAHDALTAGYRYEADFRLAQLRSVAEATAILPVDGAAATGAFWLLNADLIAINRDSSTLLDQQFRAISRLQAFLGELDGSVPPLQLVREVQLGLLRLYVQTGQSERACALLKQLQDQQLLPLDDSSTELAQAICHCIGTVPDLAGEPAVRLIVFAEQQAEVALDPPKSVEVIRYLVGPETLDQQRPLLQRFAVRALPWYVLVGGEGQIVAIGQTEAILRQAELLISGNL